MNPEELIAAYHDGTLDEAGSAALNAWLKAAPENMRHFTSEVMFDQRIRGAVSAEAGQRAVQSLIEPNVSDPPKQARWFSLRPLSAAAAGLVIGLFSATLVWAAVGTKSDRFVQVLHEGFEDVAQHYARGFPATVGVWTGDVRAAEATHVAPNDGAHMAALVPLEKRRFAYAYRLLNVASLPQGERRRIEVTASFHGDAADSVDRYQIRLVAFADGPEIAKDIWLGNNLDEDALIHVAKTVTMPKNEHGWKTLQASMDVPSGAKTVLVSLAAAVADDAAPKTLHYLDDVRIQLILQPHLP